MKLNKFKFNKFVNLSINVRDALRQFARSDYKEIYIAYMNSIPRINFHNILPPSYCKTNEIQAKFGNCIVYISGDIVEEFNTNNLVLASVDSKLGYGYIIRHQIENEQVLRLYE